MTIVDSVWSACRIKLLATKIGSGKTPAGGAETYQSSGVIFLRSQNIHFDGLHLEDVAYIDEVVHREMRGTRVFPGDVLLNITGASLGRVTYYPEGLGEANVNQHVCIIRPNDALNSRYLSYALAARSAQGQILSMQVGGNREGLNFEQVGSLEVPVPGIEMQRKIADFLDAQTNRISALESALREQISLLEMRRQAQITEAVSGQMSDAKPRALRAVAEVILGRQRAPQHADGPHMVPYLRAANVKDGMLDLTDVMSMNFTPDEQQIFALRPGDVLVTEGSGSIKAVGASAVWGGELPGVVCFQNTLLRIRPRQGLADGKFLEWWARSAFAAGEFASIATGANIYHLSAERVRALPTKFPSLDDQRKVADRLRNETENVDKFIELRERQLHLLSERRQALITAAVAGCFDVTTASRSFTD